MIKSFLRKQFIHLLAKLVLMSFLEKQIYMSTYELKKCIKIITSIEHLFNSLQSRKSIKLKNVLLLEKE